MPRRECRPPVSPPALSLLHTPVLTVLLPQGGGGGRPTTGPLGISKKDPDVRRRELLGGGAPASLAAALCALCAQQAGQLVRSQHGSDVLMEVCRGGEGGLLLECLGEGAAEQLAAVHDALVAVVAGGDEQAVEEEEEEEEEEAAAEEAAEEAVDNQSKRRKPSRRKPSKSEPQRRQTRSQDAGQAAERGGRGRGRARG